MTEAELALLTEAETRPNRQAQITFIRTHCELNRPHGWADFRSLRQRRDRQLYQAIWQQPSLIDDPAERILILSALKYGIPGYEIDLEATLTPMELVQRLMPHCRPSRQMLPSNKPRWSPRRSTSYDPHF